MVGSPRRGGSISHVVSGGAAESIKQQQENNGYRGGVVNYGL